MPETITAFVGPNGSGKTYAAVHLVARPALLQGRKVVSNLRLYPEQVGADPDLFVPLESWRQISTLRECVLLLDEISSVLPSRQASTVPPDLMRRLNQLRKADCTVAWTAPAWARCDVALREVTQVVTKCKSRLDDPWKRQAGTYSLPWHPTGRAERGPDGKPVRNEAGWYPRRWFTWLTYDRESFDEFTMAAAAKVKPRRVQHHWRPASDTGNLYRTLEEVGLLDHLDDTGVCLACNGQRTRSKCSCERPEIMPRARHGGGAVLSRAERRESML